MDDDVIITKDMSEAYSSEAICRGHCLSFDPSDPTTFYLGPLDEYDFPKAGVLFLNPVDYDSLKAWLTARRH